MEISEQDIIDWLSEDGRFTPGWEQDLDPLVITATSGFSLSTKESLYAGGMLVFSVAALIVAAGLKEPLSVSLLLAVALCFSLLLKWTNEEKVATQTQENESAIGAFYERNKERNRLVSIHNHLNVILEVLRLRAMEISERDGAKQTNNIDTQLLFREIANLRRGFFHKIPVKYQEGVVSLIKLGVNKELKRAFFILDKSLVIP